MGERESEKKTREHLNIYLPFFENEEQWNILSWKVCELWQMNKGNRQQILSVSLSHPRIYSNTIAISLNVHFFYRKRSSFMGYLPFYINKISIEKVSRRQKQIKTQHILITRKSFAYIFRWVYEKFVLRQSSIYR